MHQAQSVGNQSQRKQYQSSPSRRGFIIKKRQRSAVRSSRFRGENFQEQLKTANETIFPQHVLGVKQQQKQDNMVFKNIQTIRKVATFIQNAKARVVKQIPKLQPLEAFYLQNQDAQQQKNDRLIPWNNPFLIAFESALMIMIFMGIWLSTYQLILGKIQNGHVMKLILLILHLISIILTFNTELKTEKLEIISTRIQIFWIFLKQDCIYESITVLSIILQLISIQVFFYPERIIFLISLHTALKTLKKIQDNFAVSTEVESIIGIIKLAFKIFVFLHFLSLFFNGLSQIQKSNQTWIQSNGLKDSSPFELYIHGYYWASTIMATVGFGDITPGNVIQRAVLSFIQVFCCLFFGYCVNFIGQMIGVFGSSKAIFEKDIRRLNKYLQSTRIPNSVKDKVKEHFYNKHQIQQVYDKQSQQYLFNKMTENLRAQVMQKNSITIVQRSKFLNLFSEQSKKKIAKRMVKRVYAPHETLFDKDTQNIKLYLIEEGTINEFCFDLANNSSMKKKMIAKYNDEDNTIGWGNLITGYKYRSCTKSDNYALLYEIEQADFISIIKENARDFIKFHQIREKILQKQISFKKQCFVCDRLTHNVVKCPKVHFIPKTMGILISFFKNQLKALHHKRNSKYLRNKQRKQLFLQQQQNKQNEFQLDYFNQTQSSKQKMISISKIMNKPKKQARKSIDTLMAKLNIKNYQNMLGSICKPLKDSKHMKQTPIKRRNAIFTPIVSTVLSSQQLSYSSICSKKQYLQQKNDLLELQQVQERIEIDKVLIDLDPNFFPQYNILSLIQTLNKLKPQENQMVESKIQTTNDRRKKMVSRFALTINAKAMGSFVEKVK